MTSLVIHAPCRSGQALTWSPTPGSGFRTRSRRHVGHVVGIAPSPLPERTMSASSRSMSSLRPPSSAESITWSRSPAIHMARRAGYVQGTYRPIIP